MQWCNWVGLWVTRFPHFFPLFLIGLLTCTFSFSYKYDRAYFNVHLISVIVIVIVNVNSKLLKRHSKSKRRVPAYSRALRQIRVVFQRIVRGRLRSGFQRVRECVKSEGFPENSPSEAQVRLPEGERRQIRR